MKNGNCVYAHSNYVVYYVNLQHMFRLCCNLEMFKQYYLLCPDRFHIHYQKLILPMDSVVDSDILWCKDILRLDGKEAMD